MSGKNLNYLLTTHTNTKMNIKWGIIFNMDKISQHQKQYITAVFFEICDTYQLDGQSIDFPKWFKSNVLKTFIILQILRPNLIQ